MKSFLLCVCVFFCVRERESNVSKQNCIFFHSFLYLFLRGTVRPFPSLSLETQKKLKKREERNSQKSLRILREKLQNSTRRDSHSHNTHALKTFTSSHLLRKKKRERERGTFHSRALSFLLRREKSFPPLNLSRRRRPKNRNVAHRFRVSHQKSPST